MSNAQTAGSNLQTLIRDSVKRVEGLYLEETSPRFVGKVGPGGKANGRLVGNGMLDFVGDIRGRAVYFDAKSTAVKASFPLRNVEDHQAKKIRKAHERGAIAFLLVEFAGLERPRYFAVDWRVLGPAWNLYQLPGGSASITFKTIEALCLEIGRDGSKLNLASALHLLDQMIPRPSL